MERLYFLKLKIFSFFGRTGIYAKVFDKNGKAKNMDISRIRPGMFVKRYDGQMLCVTGNIYDDGIDYMIPCSDGLAYSPLCVE